MFFNRSSRISIISLDLNLSLNLTLNLIVALLAIKFVTLFPTSIEVITKFEGWNNSEPLSNGFI